jgi:mannosyltransferase
MRRFLELPARTYLGAVMLLGLILRFAEISESSIWHDEGFTMMLVQMPPAQIIARTARDVHPPLYYLLLHYWIKVFGISETAARAPSALFLLAAVPLAYVLMRRLWTERTARIAALFVATGPFLIRYSQEARMYAMVAFLILLATYLLLLALEHNRWFWWLFYALTMAAAFYTQYYVVFMVLVHWIYVALQSNRRQRRGLWNPWWWLANVIILGLFVPWLPTAYAQYTRVQQGFWIPQATVATLPETLLEFMVFFISYGVTAVGEIVFALGFVAAAVFTYIRQPRRRMALILLSLYALLGPVLVWIISFGQRPIFVDRYFTFAAIAFYCLLAIFVAELKPKAQVIAIWICLVLFAGGIVDIHIAVDHKMRNIAAYVNHHYQPGDELISGEIYTFFDFTYYNKTGVQDHIWLPQGVNGYAESSLFYDRANQIVVRKLSTIHPASGKLWMIGKTGYQPYYDPRVLPSDWRPIGPKIQAGYVVVQEYQVPSR